MDRNSSPTSELSVSFECLRLDYEKQNEDGNTTSQANMDRRQSEWRENSPRTNQSDKEACCSTDNLPQNQLMMPPSAQPNPPSLDWYQSSNAQQHHQLSQSAATAANTQLLVTPAEYQTTVPCNCMCHHDNKSTCLLCDCRTKFGVEHQVPNYSSSPPVSMPHRLSCRQEALYNDVTVEELAGYFDELLHLPKPMSAMAELMYT